MAKNVQGVIFLRNNTPYESRELARTGIVSNSGSLIDGEFILARYISDDEVKTLVGVIYVSGEQRNVTIIDMDKASSDVDDLRREINAKLGEGVSSANTVTAQLTALSGTGADTSAVTSVAGAKAYAKDYTDEQISGLDYTGITTGDGVYVANVVQTDGKISATAATLPTVETITVEGKPIIAVAEDKGTIAASAGTINAEFVSIADSGEKFTATTVEGALAELDGKITDAIDALDYTGVTTGTGVYVTNVTEENGVINATTATLPTVDDTAVAKKFVIAVDETLGEISVERGSITSDDKTVVLGNAADGGVDFSVNIDNDTLQKDENTGVISVASAALTQYVGDEDTIHISDVDAHNEKTISSYLTIQKVTTGLSEEVKEEYRLIGHSGTTIGDPVKIYKDSHIVSINYITTGEHAQNLEYVYVDVSGNTQTTYVDMSELVLEAEFASGVTVTNHVAHGVVDPTSETFLTVGEDGFKLSGVQNAINAAVEGLDADESGSTTHVSVRVVEADGKITAVTVTEDDIASAQGLADEITARTAADTALSNRLGDAVTAENTAAEQLAALSGTNADTSATTSVEGAKRYADGKVAEATADLAELSAKTVTALTSTNGSITASIDDAAGCKTYDIITDADKIKMSGFSADATSSLSGIAESDSIATAFEKTNAVITENERVTAAALNNLRTDVDTVSGNVETISGNVETISDNVETISGDVNTIKTNYVSGVSVNGNAVTVANHVAPISIQAATGTPTGTINDPAIIVNTDANGAVTLGIGYIDCGTY